MLNGKVSGVFVAPGSGQPGAKGAVMIRGKATLNGSTAPLWVIDGVIVGDGAGLLNPSDIETMTILKDAASTAIYGSEGANGVILITTKSAKSGKMQINASAKLGVSTLNNGNLEMMNGAELYDYYKSFNNQEMVNFTRWNPELRNANFDWWDLATQSGFTQDYNLSISGGNENLKSYFSVGFYDEEGAVKGYDYSRYTFRYRSTYTPFKWLTIRPSVSGGLRDVEDAQYSVTAMYSMFPWDSPYDENGELVPDRYQGWVNSQQTNYLNDLSYGNHTDYKTYEFLGNLDFDIKITDWLTFRSTNSYQYTNYYYHSYSDPRQQRCFRRKRTYRGISKQHGPPLHQPVAELQQGLRQTFSRRDPCLRVQRLPRKSDKSHWYRIRSGLRSAGRNSSARSSRRQFERIGKPVVLLPR